ncbi:MAG: Ig-like domain-containing protein, partial [Treponema sp.]|nr:Ig-like domain-containing protein [Treponema sp.]
MKKLSAKRISALNFIYRGGYKLKKALFLLIPALFFSCEQFPTWNEPVADWFDKYTNTAAVGRHEIQCPTYTDSEGSTCISSDGDKTVIMYLRNPRHYNLDIGFSESGATCRQDENDKAVIYLTYPESYLKAHDSGKEIGGTLTLRESVSGREFESYSFNLKCNTPPPSLMDASVQSSGGKYIICFYLPTDELISERHIGNTHTLFIDGNEIASGTAAELAALSAERPADLASLDGSPAFTGTSLSGYTPFYWETGKDVNVNDDATWILQLADNNGLKSAEATAGTRIKKPTLVLGSDITVAKGNTNVSITPQVTDFNGTAGYQVETDDTSIAEASVNNGTISINPKSGGTTSMKVTAIAGGHAAVQTINITVLEISIPTGDEVMIVGGDDTTISPTALGFAVPPEYTWESDNPSVATVDGSGKITAVNNGTAKITVSTTYGGTINVKAEKNISVYKFTLTGDDYGFVGDSTNTNDFYL